MINDQASLPAVPLPGQLPARPHHTTYPHTGPYCPTPLQIKRASDARLGVPSQCIVTRSAGIGPNTEPRGRLQYCANVALKINAKLDGVNVRLAGGWRRCWGLLR